MVIVAGWMVLNFGERGTYFLLVFLFLFPRRSFYEKLVLFRGRGTEGIS